jgi:DNA or RNA helicases of superfamily II
MSSMRPAVTTAYVDMHTSREEREAIKHSFQSGAVRIVVNVGVLTTGVDWDVRCLILARPTKSEILYVQIVGRALRTAPGKDHALILDHSDTTLRLGLPTDIHHEHLDDGKPLQKTAGIKAVPKPHECVKCHYLMAATTSECPSCGWVSRRQSNVITVNGTLAEVRRPSLEHPHIMKQRWHAELLGLARERGKSDKWVLATYRSKFNEWPMQRSALPVHPGAEVVNYVRSRNIAYAKRMRQEQRQRS